MIAACSTSKPQTTECFISLATYPSPIQHDLMLPSECPGDAGTASKPLEMSRHNPCNGGPRILNLFCFYFTLVCQPYNDGSLPVRHCQLEALCFTPSRNPYAKQVLQDHNSQTSAQCGLMPRTLDNHRALEIRYSMLASLCWELVWAPQSGLWVSSLTLKIKSRRYYSTGKT